MPLPFIPVAIGLGIAGVFGIGKGIFGAIDFSDAKEMDKNSRKKQEEYQKKMEAARSATNSSLEALGQTKIDIYTDGSISEFIPVAQQLKNMPDTELAEILEKPLPLQELLHNLKNIQVNLLEIAGGLGVAAGAGALAGLGAFGGVGMFAAAGTGTAIAALHGAAAANATLAWLGGGTLAAGGFGVAGGMAMIGGIIVGPALLVGGWVIAAKGEKALEQARENKEKVDAYAKSIDGICANLLPIKNAADFISDSLKELDELFSSQVNIFRSVVEENDDYRTYAPETKKFVKNCFIFCEQLCKIMDVKIMDDNGTFIQDSVDTIRRFIDFIREMNEI